MVRHSFAAIRAARIRLTGHTVYRRRAHLVVWDEHMRVTVAPWPLYWSPYHKCTLACVSRVGGEGLWLRVVDCIGHWDWFTGEVRGARILDGYAYDECEGPLTEQVWEHPTMKDPDTNIHYWYSDRGRLTYHPPQPLAHT